MTTERVLYIASIKGNPSRTHLRFSDSQTSLCGRKPGQSKGTLKMKDRTGWYLWHRSNRPPVNCAECLALDPERQ